MKKDFVNLMTKGRKKRVLLLTCICLMTLASGMLAGCSSAKVDPGEAVSTSPVVDGSPAAGADAVIVEEIIEDTLSADRFEVEGMMDAFVEAYFAGDVDTIEQYLSESYGQEVEVYSDPEHADEVQISAIRSAGSDPVGNIGDECEMSLEFMNPGEDSFSYLTVSFVKEESGWKVSFYGLEK